MRWRYLILVGVPIGAVFLIAALTPSNPLRQSDADLRAWLFIKTPLGSTSNEVRSAVERLGWNTDGYKNTLPRPARDPFIAGELGGYQGIPWYKFVSAFWEFDSSNRLADIRIRRIVDSP
jgi:hypothetical protein